MALTGLTGTVVYMMQGNKTVKQMVTLACAALPLLGLGLYAKSKSAAAEKRTSTEYAKAMLGCAKGVYTLDLMRSNEVQKCILGIMKDAGETLQVVELNEGIAYAIDELPMFFDVCHDLGHPAGRHIYSKYPDIVELLQSTGSTCQYAIGHGILDGFASTKPDEVDYMRVVEACMGIENPVTSSFCADGLGHVAWSSTEDLTSAARRCAYITKQNMEEACVEGILMQIYEPAGFAPSRDMASALRDIPTMCANWPMKSRAGSVAGCHKGAGYIFTRNLVKNSRLWETSSVMTGQLRENILENIEYALRGCGLLTGENAVSTCHYSLSQQYPSVIHYDKQIQDSACLPLGEWEERCRNWKISVK